MKAVFQVRFEGSTHVASDDAKEAQRELSAFLERFRFGTFGIYWETLDAVPVDSGDLHGAISYLDPDGNAV